MRWSDFRNAENSRWDHKDAPCCLAALLHCCLSARLSLLQLQPTYHTCAPALCVCYVFVFEADQRHVQHSGAYLTILSPQAERLHAHTRTHRSALIQRTGMILMEGSRFCVGLAGETLYSAPASHPSTTYRYLYVLYLYLYCITKQIAEKLAADFGII